MLIRRGSSKPCTSFAFTIEAGPSSELSAGGEIKKEFAEQDNKRFQFFEQFLSICNKTTTLFSSISPVGYQNWINAGAGKSGVLWTIIGMKKASRVEFFFCSPSSEINRKRFDLIESKKMEIEGSFGEPLFWDFKDHRKQQYIRSLCPLGGFDDEEKWTEIQNDLTDRLIRLEKALRPYIKLLD